MTPNHRRQDRELDALYATLPRLDCQGYCADSCGPIAMSVRERARIVERARKPVTADGCGTCSMLTADRRCGVYDIRPLICRLWGIVERMPCPYGCRPEGGLLPDTEGARLLGEAHRIGGADPRMLERLAAESEPLMRLREDVNAALGSGEKPVNTGQPSDR